MTNSQKVGFLGGLLLISALSSFLLPSATRAAEFRTGDQVSFSTGQTLVNDLYMAGGNVTSSGTIQGDLTAAGGTLLINGPVSADALLAGGTVTLLSEVTGDVRITGGTVVIQGVVQGDVIGAGGQITLSGPSIGGDVALAGGSISIDTPIKGTLRVAGGEVRINAPISGNVELYVDSVVLGPNAVLSGDFTYRASKEVTKENGAVIQGVTNYTPNPDVRGATKAGIAAFFTFWLFAKLVMSLVGALFFGIFFHRFARELVATAATQPLMEIGRGAIFLIVAPIASLILLITIIGIPLGMIGLLMYAATMIFISLLMPIVIGSVVYTWIAKTPGFVVDWKTILLGVVIYFILGLIPFVGWILNLGIFLITLGAALYITWNGAKEWR